MAVNNAPTQAETELEQQLQYEILRSERLRVTLLAGLFGAVMLYFPLVYLTLPDNLSGFRNNNFIWPLVGILMVGLIYELFVRRTLTNLIKRNQTPPIYIRYVNAFVETSIPSVMLFFFLGASTPIYALLLPPGFFYFIFIALSSLRLDAKLCVFTGAVAAVEYMTLAIYAIGLSPDAVPMLASYGHHIGKSFLLLMGGGVTGFVTEQIRNRIVDSFKTLEERNRVVSMFGQHVSPAVVDKLLTQKTESQSEVRHVCVMFLDIRNFTTFSECRSPEEVVSYLNALFGSMIEIINCNGGIINKFLGDGFMAVFGAPLSDGKDCENAVRAAREMLAEVERQVASGQIPPTKIGIGLHTGEALTGNVGSAVRKEYTIIGDVVNLASRIEQLNKQFTSQLLVSGAVSKKIGKDTAEAGVSLGMVAVKGREAEIEIFKLA